MSDVEAIDAVFGEHRSTLARIQQAAAKRKANAWGAAAGPREQSTGARWGLNPDPEQRAAGFKLLMVGALLLVFLLAAKIGC